MWAPSWEASCSCWLMSLVKEPTRRNLNAIVVEQAGLRRGFAVRDGNLITGQTTRTGEAGRGHWWLQSVIGGPMAPVGSSLRTHCLSPARIRLSVDAAIGPARYARMFPDLPAFVADEAFLHAIG